MTIQGCSYGIEGALVAFLGDTPAVNMVGGFKEGIGRAMRKCRHCLATNPQIQTKVIPSACCKGMYCYTYSAPCSSWKKSSR